MSYGLVRDGSNIGEQMMQRIMGISGAGLFVPASVGTGFAGGGVGMKLTMGSGMFGTIAGTGLQVITTGGWIVIQKDPGMSSFDPRSVVAGVTSSTTLAIPANNTGATRQDTVAVRFDQSVAPASDGANLASVVYIVGNTSSPNAPSDGALYAPVANIAVLNGGTAPNTITDLRTVFGNPGGVLGTASVSANQTGITAAADVTGLTYTTGIAAHRLTRISALSVLSNNTAGGGCGLYIYIDGAQATEDIGFVPVAGDYYTTTPWVVTSLAGGTHTFKIQAGNVGAGTVTLNSGSAPSVLVIEDVGSA